MYQVKINWFCIAHCRIIAEGKSPLHFFFFLKQKAKLLKNNPDLSNLESCLLITTKDQLANNYDVL